MSTTPSFIELFRRMAAQRGDAPAVLEAGRAPLSYAELARRTLALAAQLADLGIGRETVIGLCARKSGDYIASLLGVWSAGAAFVPLDPDLPRDRLAFMVKKSGAQIVLTPEELRGTFEPLGARIITPEAADDATPGPTVTAANPDDLAYIIFTSGSTGRPKGVMVTHRGIVNLLTAQIEAFRLTPASRSLLLLSTSFDASISDIGTTLLSGATLCIEPPEALRAGRALVDTVRRRHVTHLDIPPALLRAMDPAEMPLTLETIIIGGEVCPPAVVRKWAARFRVVNVYGPTEATVCTSLCTCDAQTWDDPLIGLPIANIHYAVLDADLNPVPGGTPGELCLGGIGLARGYANEPELTANRFIFRDGQRLYRTGDHVVQRPDGQWKFLGRLDRQIKLHGRLVAPEEIEARLAEHPKVSRAAVVKRPLPTEPVREGLVAFIVPADAASSPSPKELTAHLSARLPQWMQPRRFEFSGALPVTSSGKLDRNALQSMPLARERRGSGHSTTDEITADARILIEIWEKLLGVESVGLHDDFVELGGDSVTLLESVLAAEARGLMIPPPLLSERMTIGQIVSWLRDKSGHGSTDAKTGHALPPGAMNCDELRLDVALIMARQKDSASARQRKTPATLDGGTIAHSIFLTGATGFLGSRLLPELLRRTAATVCCLVRAADAAESLRRIMTALTRHGVNLNSDELERISVCCGDLDQPQLGLGNNAWDRMTDTVDIVYHCAAWVNAVQPYAALRAGNVLGTAEMLRFTRDGRPKRLHYASTLSVFVATDRNAGMLKESDVLAATGVVYGGYAQSKWAAEWMLRSADSGDGSTSYYRFGLITGDSQSGYCTAHDHLGLFIRSLAALGCVPDEVDHLAVDVTPVDFAAAAMAHLSIQSAADLCTWHIANRRSLMLGSLVEAMNSYGLRVARVSASEWEQRVAQSTRGKTDAWPAYLGLCRAMAGRGNENDRFSNYRTMDLFQATGVQFAMENTLAGLAGTGIVCPEPTGELLEKYLRYLFRSGASESKS